MKAMIFAAGRGERMRPLTDTVPKPLLLIGDKPIIVHAIEACREAGITELVINLSYLADIIMEALGDGSRWGVKLHYSIEGDPPLETAGGIINALPLLGSDPFLVFSADVWTRYDLSTLVTRASQVKLAHLVLVPNPSYHPTGDFVLLPDGTLCDEASGRYTYGSFGILHPKLFEGFPVQRMRLGSLLYDNLKTGFITGELYQGPWYNMTTPEDLYQAQEALKETT